MKKFKLFLSLLMLVCFSVGTVWADDPTVLFHETFGDNASSARDWNDSYSVKSGVAAVYEGVTSYEVSNGRQGKNTTGSTLSGLNQKTAGTDAYIVIGPLSVANYTTLGVTYQWKAASVKETYTTKLEYKTSSDGTFTEVSGTGDGATGFVERVYSLPSAAQVATLYLKITWNTSNTSAIIDELELTGVKGGGPEPECTNTVTVAKGEATNGTFKLSDESVCGDGEGGEVFVTNIEPAAGYVFDKITATNGTVDTEKNKVTGITANTTITVSFKEIEKYTVSFDTGDGNGSVAPETEAVGGQGITLPDGPSSICSEAWTFAGWCETSVGTETTVRPTLLAAGSTYSPSDNTKLYAVYKRSEAGTGAWFNLSIEVSEVTYYVGAKGSGSFLLAVSSVDEAVAFKYEDGYLYYDNNGTNMYISSAGNNTTLTVATAQPTVTWTESGTTAVSYQSSGTGNRYLGINTGVSPIRFAPYTDSETYPHNLTKEAAGTTYYLSALNCCSGHNVAIADGIENGEVKANTTSACEGTRVTLTVTPNEGYVVKSVTLNGDPLMPADGVYFFDMVGEDVTISAVFEKKYAITIDSNIENGTVVADPTAAAEGAEITLTASPAENYKLAAWDVYKTGEKSTKVSVTDNKFTMPAYDVTVSADFTLNGYTITIDPTIKNGTVEVKSVASAGEVVEITAHPNAHYKFDVWYVSWTEDEDKEIDVVSSSSETTTFTMPEKDVTVWAGFKAITSAVTIANPVGGTISVKDGETAISSGSSVAGGKELTVAVAPNSEAYKVSNLRAYKTGDPTAVIPIEDGKLTMPDYAITITADATALFEVSVAVNNTAYGSATINDGAGPVYVTNEEFVNLVATPAGPQYEFVNWTASNDDILIDNAAAASTTAMIGAAGTITANFKVTETPNLTVSTDNINFGSIMYKDELAAQSFNIDGANLTGEKILLSWYDGSGADVFALSATEVAINAGSAHATITVTPRNDKCDEFYDILEISTDGVSTENVEISLKVNKLVADLAWDKSEFTANLGEENTFPTLNNPRNLPVVYGSYDPEVAAINATTGEIDLKKAGFTYIVANFAGNDTVNAVAEDAISYELTVTQKYTAKWYVNNVEAQKQTAAAGDDLDAFPTDFSAATDCSELAFIGWLTAPLSAPQTEAPSGIITETESLKMPEGGVNYYAVFAEKEEDVTKEEYQYTIAATDFNATSYSANNNEKTRNAVCTTDDSKKLEVKFTSNQVMLQSSKIQGQKNTGYIYNAAAWGSKIKSVTINDNANYTYVIGAEEQPTTTAEGAFFKISAGSSTSTASSIDIVFEYEKVNVSYSSYVTTCPSCTEVELARVVKNGSLSLKVKGVEAAFAKTCKEAKVAVEAIPNEGYELKNITIDGVAGASINEAKTEITIPAGATGELTVTAVIGLIDYKVTMAKSGCDDATISGDQEGKHVGDVINISASAVDCYAFLGWVAEGATVEFANAKALETTFTMPASDVTITAKYAKTLCTMDEIFAKAKEVGETATNVYVSFNNWVVTGAAGSNAYITDGEKGFLLYTSSHGFAAGDKLNGVAACKVQLYYGAAELTNLTATTEGLVVSKGGAVTPMEKKITEVDSINTAAPIIIKNVTYKNSLLYDENNNEIKPYNKLYSQMSFVANKTYNVTGIYLQFGTTKQIMPRSAADIVKLAEDITLEWSAAAATAYTKGKPYSLPTLTNPSQVAVTYESTVPTVATVDDKGKVTVVAAGTTTIKANWAGSEEYNPNNAEYVLTVKAPTGVAISGDLDKKDYEKGDVIDLTGLEALAVYGEEDSYELSDAVWTVNDAPAAEVKVNAEGAYKIAIAWEGLNSFVNKDLTLLTHEVTFAAPQNGTLVVKANDNPITTGDHLLKGDILTFVATPAEGYRLASLKANDVEISASEPYVVGTEDIEIVVTFEEKAEAPISWSAAAATAYTKGKPYSLPTLSNEKGLTVVYESLNTAVAEIAANGDVTIKGAGSATIKASFEGNADYKAAVKSYELTVKAPASVAISGSAAKTSYTENENFDFAGLKLIVKYDENDTWEATASEVEWAADPAKMALTTTKVNVTAKWNEMNAPEFEVTVTVSDKPAVDISWPASSAIAYTVGKEYDPLPTLKNEGQLIVTYESSDEAVATIDQAGNVTIKAAGSTSIKAVYAGDETHRKTEVAYTLTVYAPQSIAISGNCTKTEYDKNAEFSYEGLIATVTYGDDSELDVTAQAIWSNDLIDNKVAEAGNVTVKATWNGIESDPVIVAVTVKEDPALGIDNAEIEMKAQKIMINGIIFIQRGDKLFNAQGQVVR